MSQSQYFPQSSKLNQQFRKQIRRKDIQRRLAQRRKQMLQQQRKILKNNVNQGCINQPNTNASLLGNQLEYIYSNFLRNGCKLNGQEIKQLARFSCSMAGSKAIIRSSKQLVNYIVEEFLMKECYNDTQYLNWALLIFNNCLTITTSIYSDQNSKNIKNYNQSTNVNIQLLNNQYYLNGITTTDLFILRIFKIASQTNSQQIKQNVMSVIFCIIYNNQPQFILNLVTNSKFSIINLLFNQMHSGPNKNILLQILRCYYLILKKLQFNPIQQFGKMRKFIIYAIKNSNCLEISIVSILCLYGLLKSLPNQKILISKSNILSFVFSQAITLKNPKLIIHSLKIASFMLQIKNQSQIKLILQFIEQCLYNFQFLQQQMYCFKLLYDMILNSTIPADQLITNYPKLFEKIILMFDENTTNKDVLIEISFCLCLLANKCRKMDKALSTKIRIRVKQIVQNWDLDEKSIAFLEQSLEMLNSIDRNLEF